MLRGVLQALFAPIALLLALFAGGAPAQARVDIAPYLEVQQVLDAPLSSGGGEVLTYTTLAAGVDASVSTRRAEVQISYRYERRIPWNNDFGVDNVHSGLAQGRYQLVPNLLTIEGGALATRARTDIRGGSPEFLIGDLQNTSQVYAFYAGPSLATTLGDFNVNGSYRFGYVRAEDGANFSVPGGQPRLDRYDRATNHSLDGSIGMGSGVLPFGWTLSGGWTRENASQLSQRFDGKFARGDIVLPVSQTVALTAGVGYEKIRQTQRDILRDADGNPVVDGNGRFVEDRTRPPLLAYDQDGLIYDAGVMWRPNRRTELQAKVGYRYGSTFVTGSFDYRVGRRTALNISVYNGIQSFGRQIVGSLSGLPTSFETPGNPIQNPFAGCIVGSEQGEGGCMNGALQSVTTSNFRASGVNLQLSGERGLWTFQLGGGYARRKYISPIIANAFSLDGVVDENVYLMGNVDRRLTEMSGVSLTGYANWLSSSLPLASDRTTGGAALSYYHQFLDERLTAQATAALYSTSVEDFEDYVNASLLLGLRYTF